MFSKWLKTDLHIHTDLSKMTKPSPSEYIGDFNIDQLHDKLLENRINMFSLTDHNIINTDAYKNYYEKYSDIFCFVGVEVDVAINSDNLKSYIEQRLENSHVTNKPFHTLITNISHFILL